MSRPGGYIQWCTVLTSLYTIRFRISCVIPHVRLMTNLEVGASGWLVEVAGCHEYVRFVIAVGLGWGPQRSPALPRH